MKRTSYYQLGYFEEGDIINAVVEMQRFETLDAQIHSLYDVIGNGIINGWDLTAYTGLSIAISSGSGNVNFVAVKSNGITIIPSLTPSVTSYIYAILKPDSYWYQTVDFVAFVEPIAQTPSEAALYLGSVVTNATDIVSVDMSGRTNLGFVDLIKSYIKAHRHIGGTDNPPPVDLSSEVQGIISQNSLPDLDASIIKTGTISAERLPLIDHITQLINQGTLTHAQLDAFVEGLSIEEPTLMGETSTIDLLQLILALKHVYPDIDRYLVNEIAYIPGISPDDYVDWVNTTADVDIRTWANGGTHTITGSPSSAMNTYSHEWNSAVDFEGYSAASNIVIDGDLVSLDTTENTLILDQFDSNNTSEWAQWNVGTNDLSSRDITFAPDSTTYVVPPDSAKLTVGDSTVEIVLVIKKTFDAMDWSPYKKIIFSINTTSVQHGDVYFYINDNVYGTQNSQIKVLNRNEPTIDVDTLQNGWQEVTVDISSYERGNINEMGFYVSSQDGWDTSVGFNLNIDDIYLTTGNIYKSNGYVRYIFGNNYPYDFSWLNWDAQIPSDSHSSGLVFNGRTRVSNTLAGLPTAIWSDYFAINTSVGNIITLPIPSALYKYIEIEVYFGASTDLSRTAFLRRMELQYNAASVDNSFIYDSDNDWNSGNKFSILVDNNTISISNTSEINDIFYGTNSAAVQLDDNLVELYNVTGSVIPRSTYQALNNIQPSLGLVTGVSRGNNGNMWLADLDNDRVLEVDKSGALVTGFYGYNLIPPVDNYGVEDYGNGSNETNVSSVVTTTTTTTSIETTTTTTTSASTNTTTTSTTTIVVNPLGATVNVLHSIYNPNDGVLYVVFDQDLENIYNPATTLDLNRIYLRAATQRFYLNDSTVELVGVDETSYNNWYAASTSGNENAKFLNQFSFNSHVLSFTLDGADKTAFSYLVDQYAPSIVIASPNQQERTSNNVTVTFLLYNFEVSAGSNGIRVTLDGGTPQDIYTTTISYTGLSNGNHTIKAQLLNADSTLNTNIEAIASGSFVAWSTTYSQPYINLTSPKINQIYSSAPVVVEFNVENFPVLAAGQHLRYVVDSEPAVDYYSTEPITIGGLDAGAHTITLYLCDPNGISFGYTYGSVTGNFIIGTNSNAVVKLYVNRNMVQNSDKTITTGESVTYVEVGNIYMVNLYAPVDVQVVAGDTSLINPDGEPCILIAKLRSPSSTQYLSNNISEFNTALLQQANSAGNVSSSTITETAKLIYGSPYLDGHSVVYLSAANGDLLFSNNASRFSDTKENAKVLLGSAEKVGDGEYLMGDSINKRVIITYTDLSNGKTNIEWQYDSDRFLVDAHIVPQDNVTISIRDDCISPAALFIRQGVTVIWENDSSAPISIYSGTTSAAIFALDPDLTLYGQSFVSNALQPGDRYTFKFVNVGTQNWFVYPSILTASINVTKNRISSQDQFYILESDSLNSPFSSRVIKVNSWGDILWEFGNSYIVKPRDVRPLLNGGVIIST